jgi:hypothetical protein
VFTVRWSSVTRAGAHTDSTNPLGSMSSMGRTTYNGFWVLV